MYGQRIKEVMEREHMLRAPPHTTVAAAARMMAEEKVSAVLVLDGSRLAGIFTERDAVFRVIAPDRDARSTTLADVMTADPITIGPDKTFGQALALMHERGIRHVPVVERSGRTAARRRSCSWRSPSWPAGDTTQSANCCASAFFTCGCLAGLTTITPYWLNRRLSPSTRMPARRGS
jgi:CBS domain-containing protein